MLRVIARHLRREAVIRSAALHMSMDTAGWGLTVHLAGSNVHLRAAAACLHHQSSLLWARSLSSHTRHISSSIQASGRGSIAADQAAPSPPSEWDDVWDLTTDRKPSKHARSGGRESRGAGRPPARSQQPAASTSGWADDWDPSSDGDVPGQRQAGGQGSWGADRGTGGSRGSWQGGSRGRGSGRGGRDSWGERGSQAPPRDRWEGPDAAPSRDSWSSSSRGRSGEARGSWQGGSMRGGRAPRPREDDREGRYGRPGNAWQPRGRPDESAVPRAPQLADKFQAEALYGVNPVLGALQAMRRDCHTLYVQEASDGKKRKEGVPQAIAAMKAAGGSIEYVTKHDLNQVVDNRPHQGLVLDCSSIAWEPMDQFPPAQEAATSSVKHPIWLALDEIEDPQNMGAALRAAYFLGASGVLTCARNSAPLSPAVSKASAGALEFMPVHACASMPRTLTQAALQGWHVIGAGNEADATSCRSFKPGAPSILVVGNEGRGLRAVVRRACRDVLRIDSVGAADDHFTPVGVESLNVSVAAGILLHQLLHAQ